MALLSVSMDWDIGEFNPRMVDMFQEIFQEEFPHVTGTKFALTTYNDYASIDISTNNVRITVDVSNFEKVIPFINSMVEKLLLGDNVENATIKISETVPVPFDFLMYTKVNYPILISDGLGTCLRQMFSFQDIMCEFKIEPYFADINNIFFESNYNLMTTEYKNVFNTISLAYNNHIEHCNEVLSNIK